MRSRVLSTFMVLALAVVGLTANVAYSQTSGSIEGTVSDSNGAPLPGASVEAKSPSLQGTKTGVTDGSGRFRFSLVPPGSYTVTVALSGFSKVERTVRVNLDATATVLVTMALSSVRETIVVTAEAPVVDTASTTAGTSYTSKQMEKLPLARNYADIVRLQPGVQTDNGETQGRSLALSIYGSTSAENLWLIDGVNTTNVIKGFQGKSINAEFIEEVEVKTGGYQAEYGRNTGGVVNVITKGGGNEFHGNVFGYLDNASTRAQNRSDQTAPYSQSGDAALTSIYPTNTRSEIGASLGGYFMKDRIWFFGAYDYVQLTQKIEPLAGVVANQQFPIDTKSNLFSGKLTFKITDTTELTGAVFADPQKINGALLVPASVFPDTYNGERDLGGTDYSARLSQIAGSWGLLQLQYARHADKYETIVPNISRVIDNTAAVLQGVPATNYGGYGSVFGPTVNNESTRDAFNGSMSFFLGSHQVKIGGDYQKDLTSGTTYYSGLSQLRIYPCRAGVSNYNCDLSKAPFADTAQGHIQVFYRHDFYAPDGQNLTPIASPFETPSKAWSGYVQDEWKVLPNLSVNLGVRYDREQVFKGDATIAMDLKDQWAPRFGFAWDFMKDGSSKLYGSAGRFYYATPTDLNVRVFTANTTVNSYNYSTTSTVQDAAAPRKVAIQIGTIVGEPVDPGTKQAFQDEYTFGLEKAIDSTLSVGAKFTYRTLGRTIEDRCDLDPSIAANGFNSCAIMNPGSSGQAASGQIGTCNGTGNPTDPTAGDCTATGVPVPDAKRIYRGFELTARKRVGDSLWMQASYLYSTLKGNYSGAIRTESGQTDPGINADFDYYQFVNNAYGPLELDHPHSFRFDGSWTAPFGLQAGVGFHVRSGSPISRQGWFNGFYTTELFLDPRGENGRTPTEWDADLQLAYNVKAGPVTITPQFFVYNLFNNQIATSYDQTFNPNATFVTNTKSPFYGQAGVEPGTGNCPASASGPCSDNANYLKVSGRSGARVLRFAVKVAF